jgi:hypothetical protein
MRQAVPHRGSLWSSYTAGVPTDGAGAQHHYYCSVKDPQTVLRERMREVAQARVRYGYRRVHVLLKREDWRVRRNRVYRLYADELLQLRSKRPKRRKMVVLRCERCVPIRPDEVWIRGRSTGQWYPPQLRTRHLGSGRRSRPWHLPRQAVA